MVATVKVTLASVGGINSAPKSESFNVMDQADAVSTSIACDTGDSTFPGAAPVPGPVNSGRTGVAYVRVSGGDVWFNTSADTGVAVGPGNGVRLFQDDKVFMSVPTGHYVGFSDDTG